MKHAALATTAQFWTSLPRDTNAARTARETRGPLDEHDARRLSLASTLLTARDLSILTAALSDPAVQTVEDSHKAFSVATRNAGVPGIGSRLDATLDLAGGAVGAVERADDHCVPRQLRRELRALQSVLSHALVRVVRPSLCDEPRPGVPLLRDAHAVICMLLCAFLTDADAEALTRAEIADAARRARIWSEPGEQRSALLKRTRETARRALVAGVDGVGDAVLELVLSGVEHAMRGADPAVRERAMRSAARAAGRIQASPTGDRYIAPTDAGRRWTLAVVDAAVSCAAFNEDASRNCEGHERASQLSFCW